jgi:hypothetical protein
MHDSSPWNGGLVLSYGTGTEPVDGLDSFARVNETLGGGV